jgi:hypothetical protein
MRIVQVDPTDDPIPILGNCCKVLDLDCVNVQVASLLRLFLISLAGAAFPFAVVHAVRA